MTGVGDKAGKLDVQLGEIGRLIQHHHDVTCDIESRINSICGVYPELNKLDGVKQDLDPNCVIGKLQIVIIRMNELDEKLVGCAKRLSELV